MTDARYTPFMADILDRLGGPEQVLARFAEDLDQKLRLGEEEYGDGSFSETFLRLLRGVEEEALDFAGWGVIMYARAQCMRSRLERARDRTFQGEFIFVSGPYSADDPEQVKENVVRAMVAGQEVLKRGHWPFVPHLMFASGDRWDMGWEKRPGLCYEAVLQACLAWVTLCDSILTLGPSPGADRELARAERLGLRVYQSIESIPTVPLWDGEWEGVVPE